MKLRIQKKTTLVKRLFIAAFILLSANTRVEAQCSMVTVNPGFEQPAIPGVTSLVNYTTVPGWITTETDSLIEIWKCEVRRHPILTEKESVRPNRSG